MKRYFGGIMVLLTLGVIGQNYDKPEMAGAVGLIVLLLGIPGAIWLFRKTPKR